MDKRIFQVALTMIPQLGSRSLRQLLELYPDPRQIFEFSPTELKLIFGNHADTIQAIHSRSMFDRAQDELDFADKYKIKVLFYTDNDYPQRLNSSFCNDTPVVVYARGECNLNTDKALAVVGSRHATVHGKEYTHHLIEGLRDEEVTIVSGLAYGIDTMAHTAALDCGLPTVAVLGHGLDQIYPSQNRGLAERILNSGGTLLTEYPHTTRISPGLFPARNRIIAALTDGTLVAESAQHGGSLITAAIANSYNREVMAVPGRPTDTYSSGCNSLIIENRAAMVRNADDIMRTMCWERHNASLQNTIQQEMFAPLNNTEKHIIELLTEFDSLSLDEIAEKCELTLPKAAATLLEMELKSLVTVLPGCRYKTSSK